jgi:hypothetical protein
MAPELYAPSRLICPTSLILIIIVLPRYHLVYDPHDDTDFPTDSDLPPDTDPMTPEDSDSDEGLCIK